MELRDGDPEFLRKVAREMRSRRDLTSAMELERIAADLESGAKLTVVKTMENR